MLVYYLLDYLWTWIFHCLWTHSFGRCFTNLSMYQYLNSGWLL